MFLNYEVNEVQFYLTDLVKYISKVGDTVQNFLLISTHS